MALSRLIYVSEPQFDPSAGSPIVQLSGIMSASKRNNAAADITGALVYDESWFIQALEGDRHAIWRTYKRIEDDDRHATCLLVEMIDTEERLFGNWWMGLCARDAFNEQFFAPFCRHGRLCADMMSAHDILELMVALSHRGLHREMRTPVLDLAG